MNDRALRADGFVKGHRYAVAGGHVTANRQGIVGADAEADGRLEGFQFAPHERHLDATGEQRDGDGAADTTAGTGDYRVGYFVVHEILSWWMIMA